MNTLSISDIFQNLDYYKTHYLSILSHPDQYFTPVENAYIRVWPLGYIDLFLGDLLHLWFSEKWLINDSCLRLGEHKDDGRKTSFQRENDLYLYQLAGSALSGSNHSQVWSQSENKAIHVSLNSVFQYYANYKGTSAHKLDRKQLLTALKSAV